MEKKELDLEAAEPLLSYSANKFIERKPMTKISATRREHPNDLSLKFKKIMKGNEPQYKKQQNKFIFKVYLHIICQCLFLLLMIYMAFKLESFQNLLIENNIPLYIAFIILLITFIHPLISVQALKTFPLNYFYLFVFTLCLGYIICRIAITLDFSIIKIFVLLNICQLIYLSIESLIIKEYSKTEIDIANSATFMGLFILFVGGILCYIDQIKILKFGLIILILVFLGVYIIYDMNCIVNDKRRTIKIDEYVVATMFLYIDIFQTFLELMEKFYSSCESERKPIKKPSQKKSMIFTGEEDYQSRYRKAEDDKKENDDEYSDLKRHIRRRSSIDLKRRMKVEKETIIEEEEVFNSDKEENNNINSKESKTPEKFEIKDDE